MIRTASDGARRAPRSPTCNHTLRRALPELTASEGCTSESGPGAAMFSHIVIPSVRRALSLLVDRHDDDLCIINRGALAAPVRIPSPACSLGAGLHAHDNSARSWRRFSLKSTGSKITHGLDEPNQYHRVNPPSSHEKHARSSSLNACSRGL